MGAQLGRIALGTAPSPTPTPSPSNLLVNGTFDSNAAGWTFNPLPAFGDGAGSLNAVTGKGRLVADPSPGFVLFRQSIACEIGATYRFTGDIHSSGSPGYWGVRITNDDQMGSVLTQIVGTDGNALTTTFVANATTVHVMLQVNGGTHVEFDNLTVLRV